MVDRINQYHANQIEQNLRHDKQIHETEIERTKQINAAEIERIKQIKAAEIVRIKQELDLVKSERDYYKDMALKHIFNTN